MSSVEDETVVSRFYNLTIIDPQTDDVETKFKNGMNMLKELTDGLSEKEIIDRLTVTITRDRGKEELIYLGMLMVILTEPDIAPRMYYGLRMLVRDGFVIVNQHLGVLIMEKYGNFTDSVRTQLLWLIREMVRNMVPNVDSLCWNLMRNAASGDCSARNLHLVDSLLDIFQENRKWLEKFPWLVASVIYSFLRFIEDHIGGGGPTMMAAVAKLRQKEVQFVVSLLRERFADCLVIGRDFVRLLMNVARIPEFEMLWRDILHNPASLAPNFTGGIRQILQQRTSRRFLQSRLTPDMERKLVFLTSSVRFGNHKRYQDWFQRQYLSTAESQTLRADLIRFIVGVIHPTNELLSSDILPRWAIIGWLITSCNSNVTCANAKMALFFDWFFFDPEKDNIMNIEPAILVMTNSLKTHSSLTASLLDFLCKTIVNFYPPLTDHIQNGVKTSFHQILDKRVLTSLLPLFDNPRLDRELRNVVRHLFPEFYYTGTELSSALRNEDACEYLPPPLRHLDKIQQQQPTISLPLSLPLTSSPSTSSSSSSRVPLQTNSSVAVKQDDSMAAAGSVASTKSKPRIIPAIVNTDSYKALPSDWRSALYELYHEVHDNDDKSFTATENFLKLISDYNNNNNTSTTSNHASNAMDDMVKNTTVVLFGIYRKFLLKFKFPTDLNRIDENIDRSFFLLYDSLFRSSAAIVVGRNANRSRQFLPLVLNKWTKCESKIGYLFLYYIHAKNTTAGRRGGASSEVLPDHGMLSVDYKEDYKFSVYKDWCCHVRDKKFEECLTGDLQACHREEVYLFLWLITAVYRAFPRFAVNNDQFLKMILSGISPIEVQDLSFKIVRHEMVMFDENAFTSLVSASLSWESVEQLFFWQLVEAHDIPLECLLNSLPKLNFTDHSEAITYIMLQLKRHRPTINLLKPLFCRDLKPTTDTLVPTVLSFWSSRYIEDTAAVVSELLISRCPTTSPTKKKRSQGGQGLGSRTGVSPPSAERILGHLDKICDDCLELFAEECMQKALRVAYTACTDTQKQLYGNLFELLLGVNKIVANPSSAAAASSSSPSSSSSLTGSGSGGNSMMSRNSSLLLGSSNAALTSSASSLSPTCSSGSTFNYNNNNNIGNARPRRSNIGLPLTADLSIGGSSSGGGGASSTAASAKNSGNTNVSGKQAANVFKEIEITDVSTDDDDADDDDDQDDGDGDDEDDTDQSYNSKRRRRGKPPSDSD